MTVHELLSNGIAALAHSPDHGLQVHGVILGEGDVTRGLSGKRTRWPADVLRDLADMAEGKPITLADSLDPEQHVGVEVTDDGPELTGAVSMADKVGEITDAAYEDGVGLLFEGFVADGHAEDLVERGLAQVSPVIMRELSLVEGSANSPDALWEAESVSGFRDLALVADGAAPSNEIQPGTAPPASMPAGAAEALAARFDADTTAFEALSLSSPSFDGWSDAAWDAPTLSGTFDGSMEDARNSATWVDGEGDTFGDLSLFVVDGDGEANTNALDAAWRMAPQTDGPSESDVARLRSLYEDLAAEANDAGAISDDEFADVWQDRLGGDVEAGAAAASADDHRRGDDGPNGGLGPSTAATWRTNMSKDDLTDRERELLARAAQLDDPEVVEADAVTELDDDAEELIDAAADVDDPGVVDSEAAEAMRERVAIVDEMLAEALQERAGLKETTVEAMSFEAKAAEFRDDDGDLDVEALTQSPETGSAPTGDGDDGLTDADRERIEEIDTKLDAMGSALPDSRAEALREEAADLADADDYEAALEVL